jgi:hypothetical protein
LPCDRLVVERTHLQPIAAPYVGKVVRVADRRPPPPSPVVGLQHPLSVYDEYAGAAP